MKNTQFYIIIPLLFILWTSQCFAANDFWMGYKYSVSVRYIGKVDTKTPIDTPRPMSLQMPDYPIEAMEAALSRDVIVSFIVTESGSVDTIEVIEVGQTIPDVFGAAVKSAVSKWTFHPGASLSSPRKAMSVRMKCRFEFRIKEEPPEAGKP